MLYARFVEGVAAASRSGPGGPRYEAWVVKLDASFTRGSPIIGPTDVALDFILPRDHAEEANLTNPHGADLDNLVSPILDALARNGILADGDGAVMRLTATKRRERNGENVGVHVRVTRYEEK